MNSRKTCLVTGASGGIGGAIAKALCEQGYRVYIQGRNLQKLTQLKLSLGGDVEIILGDLNEAADRQTVLTEAFTSGAVDLLVNAAGVSQFAAFEQLQADDISALTQTNLITPMLFTQAFIGFAKRARVVNSDNSQAANEKRNVTVINVGSAFGFIGYPGFSSYCASKFGLRGFTESMAREYSDSYFRFGYFAPRATQTEINSKAVDEMNAALGNAVDTPAYVAQEFLTFLNSKSREKVVGWPEKLFVRVNGLLPKVVDNAIKSKLSTIKRFVLIAQQP